MVNFVFFTHFELPTSNVLSLSFSVLNEWTIYAHARRISKFINKKESHDENVAKQSVLKQTCVMFTCLKCNITEYCTKLNSFALIKREIANEVEL